MQTLIRVGTRLSLALLVALPFAAAPPALAAPDSPHLAQHRQLTGKFTTQLQTDPAAAMKFAKAAVEAAKPLAPYDPRRGDALELLCRAYMGAQDWKAALPLAAEVLHIRRAERPPEPELVSLALLNHAVVLFGAERQAESDAALTELLTMWRTAFTAQDPRRAEKLEQYANIVQGGFGRTAWATELLREALVIRHLHPDAHLAITLYDLAVYEMLQQETAAAEAHLAQAAALFEAELRKHRDNDDMRARLVQVLVARAGIAASLGNKAQAKKLIEAARAQRFKERALQAEMRILVSTGLSEVMLRSGDLDAAIDAQLDALDVLNHSQDLIDSGALSDTLAYDVLVGIGRLYLAKPELGLARQALDLAKKRAGDTPELLFLLAELEQAGGDDAKALAHYQAALRLGKETAGEASVLFGTNRRFQSGAGIGRFGGDTADVLSFGRAEVLVPGAQYSVKSWLPSSRPEAKPFGSATDPTQLLIRDRVLLRDEAALATAAGKMMRAAKLYDGSALVFVHGFNVSFDHAVQRAAQLRRDLNYDSALFVFSWPSKGLPWRYGKDRQSADAAVTSLVQFLVAVQRATGARKIHVIAHSMGNRVLLPALVQIAEKASGTQDVKIGEVILAAPAVPQAEFVRWIDRIAAGGIDHLTLYASARDKAMWAGMAEEGTVFAGFAPSGLLLRHPRVQSIDLTRAAVPGVFEMNHDVFASNPVMTEDMRQLLQQQRRLRPDQRLPLLRCRAGEGGKQLYWFYDPAPDALSSCKP